MQTHSLAFHVSASPDELLHFLGQSGVRSRLAACGSSRKVLAVPGATRVGEFISVKGRMGIWKGVWRSEISNVVPGSGWTERLVDGPIRFREVRWRVRPEAGGARLEQRTRYHLPFSWVTEAAFTRSINRDRQRDFGYAARVMKTDLEDQKMFAVERPWKIAVTGGTGMIGQAVTMYLRALGHEVWVVSRKAGGEGVLHWDPSSGDIDGDALDGMDAVIHLAGEPIAQRWTGPVRERIYRSRVESTRLLVGAMKKMKAPPKVFLCASGINYYASGKWGAAVDESEAPADSFLARVCQHWEDEAAQARSLGTRVVLLRTSVVLSREGGALGKLLPIFKAGLGGRVGSGDQPFPWIAIDDYLRACAHLIFCSGSDGPFNLVAPLPGTNRDFTQALAGVLNRPAVVPVPRTAVRLAFGEMGRSTLLEGVDARPKRLQEEGFSFRYPEIHLALSHLLGSD